MNTFAGLAQKTGGNSSGFQAIGCELFIPNAFTPNGDNINERFVIAVGENCRVLEFNMKIFDRWGRLVFETNSPEAQKAWDGTSESKELIKGVYMYNIHAKLQPLSGSSEPEMINRHGTIVLIR